MAKSRFRRISEEILYPAILLAVFVAIVAIGLYILKCVPTYKEIVCKYDVLRDILAIFIALITIASVGIFFVLKRLIRESVESDIMKRFALLEGRVFMFHGYASWRAKDREEAIRMTKNALERGLSEVDEIWAKNNLAWYFAEKQEERPQPDLKDTAIEYAEYAFNEYDRYKKNYNQTDWIDTYAFVKSRFAENDEEKQAAKKEIAGLMKREDLEGIKKNLQKAIDYLDEKKKAS